MDRKGFIFFSVYADLLIKANKMTEVRQLGKKYTKCGGNINQFSAELGTNYMKIGQLETAENFFLTALDENPANCRALSDYALLL